MSCFERNKKQPWKFLKREKNLKDSRTSILEWDVYTCKHQGPRYTKVKLKEISQAKISETD